ncbi:hypothetical protein QF015_004090 [Paenarthrobacter sp. TE4293]|uniref:hypothetical protein n=1 Tax=Paenarthrobacter sp. TE4293 TaxID=3381695 RepID=UPI003D2399D7
MAKKNLTRTVQYWRMVNAATNEPVAEQNWAEILKTAYGAPITHLILNKEITGKVFTLQSDEAWQNFLTPASLNNLTQSMGETVYGLVATTDKDHLPNQAQRGTGEQKPVTVEEGYAPIDNLFVWFLPFGNIMAVLQESVSSARPKAIAAWLTHVMRDQNKLPQHNFHWAAQPVIDPERRKILNRASRLRRMQVGGTVTSTDSGPLRDLFLGPEYEGEYEVEFRIRHIKKRNPEHYEDDTAASMDWFMEQFGSHLGELDVARVTVDKDPGDDIPRGEIDLLAQRMTRKRTIQLGQHGQAIVASSAVSEIVEAYIQDFEDLAKLR